jgi:phage recombination protein Bet
MTTPAQQPPDGADMTDQAVATYKPRLPVPPAFADRALWTVLTDAIFPGANSPESVMLALAYCKARNLDIMKRPVNIVSVWDDKQGRNIETIWPSINEHQITAARTGEWAGLDKPVYGRDVTQSFTAYRKDRSGNWERDEFELTYPESCSVTVYRIVKGAPRAYTEEAFWLETFARVGKAGAPNAMWRKRPRAQLAKVAKAMALRAAFPEEGAGPTAEEMEGQTIDHVEYVGAEADEAPKPYKPPPPKPDLMRPMDDAVDPATGEVIAVEPHTIEMSEGSTWAQFVEPLQRHLLRAQSIGEFDQWMQNNHDLLLKLKENKPQLFRLFEKNTEAKYRELKGNDDAVRNDQSEAP